MSEAKFTPGPWAVEDPFGDSLSIVVGKETYDWRFVAHVHTDIEKGPAPKPIGKAQMAANARLIAAAPDMYAALTALLDAQYDGDPRRQEDCPLCIAARAALSKARG